jgi:hypothetical protein
MQTEADELQPGVIRLAVDQDQIRPDVTIAVVFPIAAEGVVAVLLGQRLIIRQGRDDRDEIAFQRVTMCASGFALEKYQKAGQTRIKSE